MNRTHSVGLMALLVTLLTVARVSAGQADAPQDRAWLRQSAPTTRATPSVARTSYGMWAALSILFGGAGFALWQRRRVRPQTPSGSTAQITVEGITRLSPRAQLVVVRVEGRNLLLGVTDVNVNRLAWLDGADEADEEQGFDESVKRREGEIVPDELYPRRTASPTPTGRSPYPASPAEVNTVRTSSKHKGSRFREILADAVGLGNKAPTKHLRNRAPVDELVQTTEDRYVGRSVPRHQPLTGAVDAAKPSTLINIEGQAAGLVARLNRSQP